MFPQKKRRDSLVKKKDSCSLNTSSNILTQQWKYLSIWSYWFIHGFAGGFFVFCFCLPDLSWLLSSMNRRQRFPYCNLYCSLSLSPFPFLILLLLWIFWDVFPLPQKYLPKEYEIISSLSLIKLLTGQRIWKQYLEHLSLIKISLRCLQLYSVYILKVD